MKQVKENLSCLGQFKSERERFLQNIKRMLIVVISASMKST